jgi:hypothetical protein
MTEGEKTFEKLGQMFLSYEPTTGSFTYLSPPQDCFQNRHRHRNWLAKYSGKPAGRRTKGGYRTLTIRGRRVAAHRYAWFLTHGRWPSLIDHLDGDPWNNRISNLRETDESGNRMNQALGKRNTSGTMGVAFNKDRNRWVAQICAHGRSKQLGAFATFEEAKAARLAAQAELGFGPNHGRPAGAGAL